MTTLKTRTWPHMTLAGVVLVLGIALGVGPLAFAGFLAFLGACIRGVRLQADPETAERLGRAGFMGW